MTKRSMLLATSLVGAFIGLGWQGQAQAQAASGGSGTQVGEVVVTAQRRAERLSEVPITVSVVTPQVIANRGVTDTVDLQKVTSGLQMTVNGTFLAPSIRGISANGTQVGVPANVAFYVDGIYQPSQIGTIIDLPDTQDIEVLKGPQGTLYGQNAEGGAIVISTLDPKFKAQGHVSISYGNYNDVRFEGFETAPISDAVAQSLAVGIEHRDGFVTSIVTGKPDTPLTQMLFRGKLLFQPNDKVSVIFNAYYDMRNDPTIFTGQPYTSKYGIVSELRAVDRNGNLTSVSGLPSIYAGMTPWNYTTSGPEKEGLRTWGSYLKGRFDVGLGNLTWATSYQNVHQGGGYDADASPFYVQHEHLNTIGSSFIEQGDFVSRPIPVGPVGVEFSTGLFYEHLNEQYYNNAFAIQNVFTPGFGFYLPPVSYPSPPPTTNLYDIPTYQQATRDVLAGYLEATIHLTPQLSLIGGGRYSTDTMHAYIGDASGVDAFAPPGPCLPAYLSTFNGQCMTSPTGPVQFGRYTNTEITHSPDSWNNFSPRATARYKIDQNDNVYFTYNKGYRSGGLNDYINSLGPTGTQQGAGFTPPFKPETLDAYEVGYKGTLFNRLNLNVSAFLEDFANKQESLYNGYFYIIQNAASATTSGVDLDATFVATQQLTFTANVEYLEATFGSYGQKGCPVNASTGLSSCAVVYAIDGSPESIGNGGSAVNDGGMSIVAENLSHRQMERAPKWSGSAGGDYHVDTNAGRFNANLNVFYSSKELFDPNGAIYQNAYAVVDASLGWVPAFNPNLRFVLWGKNLTNTAYLEGIEEGALAAITYFNSPRQFGGRIEMKFGGGPPAVPPPPPEAEPPPPPPPPAAEPAPPPPPVAEPAPAPEPTPPLHAPRG